MNSYYQFVIYDSSREDCYDSDGIIVEISNLYTDKICCEEAAQKAVNEYHEYCKAQYRFKYSIDEVEIIK